MPFSKRKIMADIGELGLKRGDCVVVHSSFKKIGETEGGARTVIDALAESVLPEGALLFPNLNIPHAFTAANPPRFDVKKDHIRHMIGVLPEVFKFEYANVFSLHPTHSMMGIGAKAGEIVKDHDKAGLPCGPGTPWHKNALAGGFILLIGVNQHSNTTYHCAEESVPDSYQLTPDFIEGIVVLDGREITVRSRLHLWCNSADFNVTNPELETRGIMKNGCIGEAPSMLIRAGGFLDLCLEKMRQDTRYFLRRI